MKCDANKGETLTSLAILSATLSSPSLLSAAKAYATRCLETCAEIFEILLLTKKRAGSIDKKSRLFARFRNLVNTASFVTVAVLTLGGIFFAIFVALLKMHCRTICPFRRSFETLRKTDRDAAKKETKTIAAAPCGEYLCGFKTVDPKRTRRPSMPHRPRRRSYLKRRKSRSRNLRNGVNFLVSPLSELLQKRIEEKQMQGHLEERHRPTESM